MPWNLPADQPLWELDAKLMSGPRRTRRRAQRVNDLLRETAVVVAENGYHGTSLDEIADRLDLAKASLYHYFDGKEALVYVCLSTCASYVSQKLDAIARTDAPALERLQDMIVCQLQTICVDYPELSHLFLHPLDWPLPIDEALTTWRREHDEIFKRVISDGVASGELTPESPGVARMCLHGALNYVPLWLHTTESPEEAVKRISATVMRMFTFP